MYAEQHHAESTRTASAGRTFVAEPPLLHEVTGKGDPLVLMPGTLTGWVSWIAHAERLAERHVVVRAQLRNVEFAEAGKTLPPDYGIATERDGLLAMADRLTLDRFDLAGWSSGAAVSLAFALEYPERVRTLTLIEPPALWVLRDTEYDGRFHEEEMADRKLAGKEITVDDLKAFLVRAGLGGPDTDFESHPRWQVMLRNRAALSVNAIAWDYADSIERLRALQIPILLVRGKETSDLLGAPTTIIAATAPNATVLELPGGHACHLENPDRFLEAFEAHLASAAGG